jgi:hypothetical protein
MSNKDYIDENKVISRIRKRMEFGFKQYGALDLALDSRDLIEEAIQEALDMSIYLASRLEQIKMYEKIVNEDEFLAKLEKE